MVMKIWVPGVPSQEASRSSCYSRVQPGGDSGDHSGGAAESSSDIGDGRIGESASLGPAVSVRHGSVIILNNPCPDGHGWSELWRVLRPLCIGPALLPGQLRLPRRLTLLRPTRQGAEWRRFQCVQTL